MCYWFPNDCASYGIRTPISSNLQQDLCCMFFLVFASFVLVKEGWLLISTTTGSKPLQTVLHIARAWGGGPRHYTRRSQRLLPPRAFCLRYSILVYEVYTKRHSFWTQKNQSVSRWPLQTILSHSRVSSRHNPAVLRFILLLALKR